MDAASRDSLCVFPNVLRFRRVDIGRLNPARRAPIWRDVEKVHAAVARFACPNFDATNFASIPRDRLQRSTSMPGAMTGPLGEGIVKIFRNRHDLSRIVISHILMKLDQS